MNFATLGLLALCLAGELSPAVAPAEPATLALGVAVEREIAGGQTHVYRIESEREQLALVQLEQRGIDIAVEVLGAGEEVLAEFDSEPGREGTEEIAWVAAPTGPLTLLVRATPENAPPGRYELRFIEMRAATDKDRSLNEARKLRAQSARLHAAGKDNEARPLIEHAVTLAENALGPEHVTVAQTMREAGAVYFAQADYAAAKAKYARAVVILEKTLGSDHFQTADAMAALASASVSMGAYPEADQLLSRALPILEKALGTEHPRLASCLMSLGRLNLNRGEREKGEAHYRRGLSILEKASETQSLTYARLSANLAQLHHDRQDYEGAEQLLQRALAVLEKLLGPEHPQLAVVFQNMGITARAKKDFAKAEQSYRRALALREKANGPEHVEVAFVLNNLANLAREQGHYEESVETSRRAIGMLEKTAGPYQTVTLLALGSIARTYSVMGEMQNAVEFQTRAETFVEKGLDLNLAAGSERQKLAYLKTIQLRTDRTVSLHLQLAPADAEAGALAALVVLQRKGRVLDAMMDIVAILRQRAEAPDRALLDQLNETTKRLAQIVLERPQKIPPAEYRQAVTDLEEKKERLEGEISQRSAEFHAQAQSVTLAAVQDSIPQNAALLEFVTYHPFDPKIESDRDSLGEMRYAVYVLRREGAPEGLDLGVAKEIDAAVDALRQALGNPLRRDVRDLARALDEKVMRPVRAHLTKEERLFISPDGALNLIPFEALVDEKEDFLVEKFAFTYLTSGRDLLRMKVPRVSKSKDLLIANPRFGEAASRQLATAGEGGKASGRMRKSVTATRNFTDTYFAPLPGTLREARAIQSLFPDSLLLTGTEATEAALKQTAAPRLLHIATHGFFLLEAPPAEGAPPQNPLLRSGLALANANLRGSSGSMDDGILTGLEASGLDLWGTKLVVLSACGSGLGEVKNGEGVYGLRRAFILGGAESLLMSLWPVNDYSTRRFMADYYQHLQAGEGRGASLRQVQLRLLKAHSRLHPFSWANFIQIGEWGNLRGER